MSEIGMNVHCFSFTSDTSKNCDEVNNSFHFIHHYITRANFSILEIKPISEQVGA